ncbi:steroid 17-alpha-hydroxylase/17,20 lyase-like [Glandiceps talaboti]
MAVVVLLALLIVLLLMFKFWRDKSTAENLPPSPVTFPLVGNLPILFRNGPVWQILKGLSDRYGSIFTIYFGHKPAVILSDHTVIREAFVRQYRRFSGRPYVYSISLLSRNNSGITFSDFTPKWSGQRKCVSVALHTHINGGQFGTSAETKIIEEVEHLLTNFNNKQHRAVTIAQDISLAVMNIICNMTFNERYKIDDPEFQMILQDNRDCTELLAPGDPIDVMPILKIFPNKRIRMIENLVSRRDDLLQRKLREHRLTFDPENLRDITDALLKTMTQWDDNGLAFDEDLVVMAIWEIFTAGFQTIAETLNWAMAYLVNYQEVQVKLRGEMADVIGDRLPKWSDRASLPYLYATVLEVLRCSSISSLNAPHCTTEDTKLRGYFIPKDTMIMCNLWWVHHDPKYWKNPMKFDPARFLNAEGEVVIPQSFLPFSAGRRSCLGKQLAKMELFLFIGCLVQKFRFEDVPGKPFPDLEPMPSKLFRLVKPYDVYIIGR